MPVKREPEQAPLEQCLCIAVPTKPAPSWDPASGSRASSDPCSPEGSQLHQREEAVVGKEDPENLAERWKEGAFLAQKRGEMAPWASNNPQALPTTSFTHVRPFHASRGGCLQTCAGSHLTPLSGFPNQTATGNFNEIQKGNQLPLPNTYTRAFLLSIPPPPGKGSRELLLQGSPYSNPIHMPTVIHGSHAAHRRSRVEEQSPSLVAGETSLY